MQRGECLLQAPACALCTALADVRSVCSTNTGWRSQGCASDARRCGTLDVGWFGAAYEARSCNAAAGTWHRWLDALLSFSSRSVLVVPWGVGKLEPAQLLLGWSTRLLAAMQA